MNISSLGSYGNAWAAQIAQRGSSAQGSQATRGTQGASPPDMAKMVQDLDTDSDGSVSQTEFESFKPPAQPSEFNTAMSTRQFAQQMMGGMPPGPPPGPPPGDSADDSSSASATGASSSSTLATSTDDLSKLFSSIDGDDDGALSSDEISSFRDQMMANPPVRPESSGDVSGGTSTQSGGAGSGGSGDVSAFVQQLAQRYASLMAASDSAATSFSVSA